MKQLHFSLHDVTPFHQERLERAERAFELWGVKKVTYLFVPFFHHQMPAEESEWFLKFCERPRPFEVEWVLHGFYHLESIEASQREPDQRTIWLRKHMTDREGECLALTVDELRLLVLQGQESFQKVLGVRASHFVPPAWLHAEDWLQGFEQTGITSTEDHYGIWNTHSKKSISAPVVTWATRTLVRRIGSLLVCPILAWRHRHQALLRIAVHPHDFDFPSTLSNIEKVLKTEMRKREAVLLKNLELSVCDC
jgi:predicted deacetylase